MSQLHCKSVVVGVDGSKAAIGAAMWAIDEAISRELPLRLVHVVPREPVRSSQPSVKKPYAKNTTRAARAANKSRG